MSNEKDEKPGMRQRITQFASDSIEAFISPAMMYFLLAPWAMATFYISDFLHIDNMLFIVLIGFLTSPIIIVPMLLVTALFHGRQFEELWEKKAEEFYRSRMKKPQKSEKL